MATDYPTCAAEYCDRPATKTLVVGPLGRGLRQSNAVVGLCPVHAKTGDHLNVAILERGVIVQLACRA